MRRRLLIVLIVLAALWAALWAGASALAPGMVRHTMPDLVMQHAGIVLTEVSFSSVHISPWLNRVKLRDFHARFDLSPRDDISLRSLVDTREIEVRLRNPLTLRGSVHADGIEVRLDASDLPPWLPFDRFTNGELAVMDLPLGRPGKQRVRFLKDSKSCWSRTRRWATCSSAGR